MRTFLVFAVTFILVAAYSCRPEAPTSPAAGASLRAGTISLKFDSAPPGVAEVVAHLTRNGQPEHTLTLTMNDSLPGASGVMTGIPMGVWHLVVDALNDSGAVLFSGSTDVDVAPDQTTIVTIQLRSTSGVGNLEIHVVWGPPCAPTPSGLVSLWKGEGNTYDLVGGNHLHVPGMVYSPGKVGSSMTFGNGIYAYIPNTPSLNPTGSLTIEGWIYPTRDTSGAIMAKWGVWYGWANQRTYSFFLWIGKKLSFSISDSIHQNDPAFQTFETPENSITLNAWNHVAAVYDAAAGTRYLYINGVLKASRGGQVINLSRTISDIGVGTLLDEPGALRALFPGRIDELSFYNRALTPEEISAIFEAGSAGKCR